MTTYCIICSISPFLLPLSCGCSNFCQECITAWLREQLKKQFQSEISPLVCPAADSRHEIPLEELLEVAKGSEIEAEIEQMTLRMTLRPLSDMVFCPRAKCDYVGWVKIAEKCVYPVECEGCGSTWVEEELLPGWRRVVEKAYRIAFLQDESLNLVWKDLWTEGCPSCGALIEKNGGCPHMTCFRCHLEFCWSCMRPFRNHDSGYCSLRTGLYAGLYVVLGFLLVLKLMWLAGVIGEFCSYAFLVLTTMTLIGLGVMAVEIIANCDNCLCQTSLVLLYLSLHFLVDACMDSGGNILRLELVMIVCSVHCALGLAYIKYEL